VDESSRGYDLILPDSSFKGNAPEYGEHIWDVYLNLDIVWNYVLDHLFYA
jgi:hypothetical protein